MKDESKDLASLRDRLLHDFPHLESQLIQDTLTNSYRRFKQCRVRDYVLLLVERQTVRELRALTPPDQPDEH